MASTTNTTTTSSLPKIYTLGEIEDAMSSSETFYTDLIHGIREGFQGYTNGKFNACPIQTMGAPPMTPFDDKCDPSKYAAQVCVKSGYLTGAPYHVIKVASGGYPFPSNSGLLQLYSQKTGRLEALLLDDGVLTELRTAAAGAVALEACCSSYKNKIDCIGMLGTGVQARYQLQLLKYVVTCRNLLVYGRTPEHVEKFSKDMTKEGWTVKVAADPNDLLEQCHVIVTTTSARQAVLVGEENSIKRKRPQHITCIGADAPGKHELHPKLVAEPHQLLVADSKLQTEERGEFQLALQEGLVSLEKDVVEVGELLNRQDQQQQEQHDFSIFDSSGVAVQDCVVAQMVYDLLAKK